MSIVNSTPDSSTSLTNTERSQLVEFVRLVDKMSRSNFLSKVREQNHSIRSQKLDDGTWQIMIPDYNRDELEAFLIPFRRVVVLQQDPAFFDRVANIISRHVDTNLAKEIRKAKQHRASILQEADPGRLQFSTTPTGKEEDLVSFYAPDLIEVLLNGDLFHGDPEYQKRAEALRRTELGYFVPVLLNEVLVPVFNLLVLLFRVIKNEKLLNDNEFPLEWQMTKDPER